MAQQKQNIIQTVNRYGKQLLQFIQKKVNSAEDAEDLMQEVWYQLLHVPDTAAIDSISGWLYRVARNKIIDGSRKKKASSLEDISFTGSDGEIYIKDIWLKDSKDPATENLRKIFWEHFEEALETMPEKQRQVFILHELEGISLQQIATQTGENIKTIISRKGYAIKLLKEKLEPIYKAYLTH